MSYGDCCVPPVCDVIKSKALLLRIESDDINSSEPCTLVVTLVVLHDCPVLYSSFLREPASAL